jgi:hypothetical protein
MDTGVKSFIGFLLVINIAACNDTGTGAKKTTQAVTPNENKELVFDKLVGLWKSEGGRSFEQWVKNADGTYQSHAYSVKGVDTSWNEQANIYPLKDKWIFENTVVGQNDGKAVKFTAIILNGKTVQFSNPEHDFPTDVNYTVPDPNTLNAFIIGPNNKGGKDTIPFNYMRIK